MDKLSRKTIFCLVLIALGCAALQLEVFFWGSQPPTHPDAAEYFHLGRNIARGEGYVTRIWMHPCIPKDHLPSPETYRDPLLPYAIALCFRLFGVSYFSAGLLPLLAAISLPVITFFLARALGFEEASLTSAALAGFSPILVQWGGVALNDIPAAALTGAFWLACFSGNPWLAGLSGGLAYLTRTQAVLAVGPGLLYMLWAFRSLKKVALTCAVFLLVCSPFFYRNMRVTGRPTSSEGRYFLTEAYYPIDLGVFLKTPAQFRPPLKIDPGVVARTWYSQARDVKEDGIPFLFGSFTAAWICVLAILRSPLRKQEWSLALYLLFTSAFVVVIHFEPRYLLSLLPFVAVYTAIGLWMVIGTVGRFRRILWILAILFMIVMPDLKAFRFRRSAFRDTSPVKPHYWAVAVGEFLRPQLGPGDAVMSWYAGYYNLVLDRNVVSFMWAPEEYLREVCRRFNVRFLIASRREIERLHPEWTSSMPDWLRPVEQGASKDVLVFRVELKDTKPRDSR